MPLRTESSRRVNALANYEDLQLRADFHVKKRISWTPTTITGNGLVPMPNHSSDNRISGGEMYFQSYISTWCRNFRLLQNSIVIMRPCEHLFQTVSDSILALWLWRLDYLLMKQTKWTSGCHGFRHCIVSFTINNCSINGQASYLHTQSSCVTSKP